jgi:hypothetical protein
MPDDDTLKDNLLQQITDALAKFEESGETISPAMLALLGELGTVITELTSVLEKHFAEQEA